MISFGEFRFGIFELQFDKLMPSPLPRPAETVICFRLFEVATRFTDKNPRATFFDLDAKKHNVI